MEQLRLLVAYMGKKHYCLIFVKTWLYLCHRLLSRVYGLTRLQAGQHKIISYLLKLF